MAHLIDKDAVLAEIRKRKSHVCGDDLYSEVKRGLYSSLEIYINTLEVKEVDLDALGVLAEHLIACDAHLVTPKYTDKELDLLEELAKNNKAQKGE